jgi:hypothetical protein
MPYKLILHRNGMASVKNMETGKFASRMTTPSNALKQLRLLQALEHGFRPTGRR